MHLSYPAFVPANKAVFQNKYRNFAPLADHDQMIWEMLNNEAAYSHMRSATVCWGYPAVAGVTFLIAPLIENLPPSEVDYLKKGVGAMVCTIMENNGYKKTGVKKSVPPVPFRVFSRGEVYQPPTS